MKSTYLKSCTFVQKKVFECCENEKGTDNRFRIPLQKKE